MGVGWAWPACGAPEGGGLRGSVGLCWLWGWGCGVWGRAGPDRGAWDRAVCGVLVGSGWGWLWGGPEVSTGALWGPSWGCVGRGGRAVLGRAWGAAGLLWGAMGVSVGRVHVVPRWGRVWGPPVLGWAVCGVPAPLRV